MVASIPMREIKLTGREATVIRHLGFAGGMSGEELFERARLEPEDLVDVLNGLLSVGYVENNPYAEPTSLETFRAAEWETNPSFVQELKNALRRSR